MNETEVKPKLSKHISAAVNAIQKEIDKKSRKVSELIGKASAAEADAEILREEIAGLKDQIAKLQGE